MSRQTLIGRVAPNGAERVVARLRERSLDLVVSIPGTQVLPLWDAIDRTEGIRLVVPRSERSAGFIAEGYGLASGRPAVVMNTLGPGVANEAVAMASARRSGAPVLYVAPAQPPGKRPRIAEVFQGLDHAAFHSGAALTQFTVDEAGLIESSIDDAVAASIGPPGGPVRVDISFPILFRRTPRRAAVAKRKIAGGPPIAAPGADLILALEESSLVSSRLLDEVGLSGSRGRAVQPGIDSPGSGLSFALGLRLGRPRSPVVVVTTLEGLLGQLGVAVVANSQRVGLTFAAVEGSAIDGTVREAANATGAAWMPIDPAQSPEEARSAFLGRAKGLTVLVAS